MTCRYDIDMFRYSLTWLPSTSGGKCSCLKTVIPEGQQFPNPKIPCRLAGWVSFGSYYDSSSLGGDPQLGWGWGWFSCFFRKKQTEYGGCKLLEKGGKLSFRPFLFYVFFFGIPFDEASLSWIGKDFLVACWWTHTPPESLKCIEMLFCFWQPVWNVFLVHVLDLFVCWTSSAFLEQIVLQGKDFPTACLFKCKLLGGVVYGWNVSFQVSMF